MTEPVAPSTHDVFLDLSAFRVPVLLLMVDGYWGLADRGPIDAWLRAAGIIGCHVSAVAVLGEGHETRAFACWANLEEKASDAERCPPAGAWRLIPGPPPPLDGFELVRPGE